MQKVVTIYLDGQTYSQGNWLASSTVEKHGAVEEHLAGDLADGWRVVSVTGLGGVGYDCTARGWLAVVLER